MCSVELNEQGLRPASSYYSPGLFVKMVAHVVVLKELLRGWGPKSGSQHQVRLLTLTRSPAPEDLNRHCTPVHKPQSHIHRILLNKVLFKGVAVLVVRGTGKAEHAPGLHSTNGRSKQVALSTLHTAMWHPQILGSTENSLWSLYRRLCDRKCPCY